jgi:hypothetical protein
MLIPSHASHKTVRIGKFICVCLINFPLRNHRDYVFHTWYYRRPFHLVNFSSYAFDAEILKAHRQHNLYSEHRMFQIPLLDEDEGRYGAQVMCT